MTLDFSSWIRGCARPVLATLGALAVLNLAAPPASAAVSLSFTTNGGAAQALTSGTSTSATVGTVNYTLTATSSDSPSLSNLTTTTITVNNVGAATSTITLDVTGIGYSLGGTAFSGENMLANFSISGTGGPSNTTTDTTTGTSWTDVSNTAFGHGTPLGALAGTPNSTGNLTTPYTFASGGFSATTPFTLTGTAYSLTQRLAITLGGGDQANLTIITNATPVGVVPEPSTMAIAGLGGLGMIGYGLRRRRSR